jgi:hypothetical protein
MAIQLEDYQEVAGHGVIDELRVLADHVAGTLMEEVGYWLADKEKTLPMTTAS